MVFLSQNFLTQNIFGPELLIFEMFDRDFRSSIFGQSKRKINRINELSFTEHLEDSGRDTCVRES